MITQDATIVEDTLADELPKASALSDVSYLTAILVREDNQTALCRVLP